MKLDEAKVFTELTPRELTIIYALVSQVDFTTLNKFLDGLRGYYASKGHIDSLFKHTSNSGQSTDQYKLYKKLEKLMNDVVEKTEPKIRTVYYFVAVSEDHDLPYISGAHKTYEDAENYFNQYMKSSFKLVEIASREVDTNI